MPRKIFIHYEGPLGPSHTKRVTVKQGEAPPASVVVAAFVASYNQAHGVHMAAASLRLTCNGKAVDLSAPLAVKDKSDMYVEPLEASLLTEACPIAPSEPVAAKPAASPQASPPPQAQTALASSSKLNSNPHTWLIEHGFDPDGDLCASMESKRNSSITSTAMYEASEGGELGVCQWLFEHGAASTIRTPDSRGCTPMLNACDKGHLDVAKWLYEVGAAEDVRTKSNDTRTPMQACCLSGRLDVAEWLYKVGAAKDIRTKDKYGECPMLAACLIGHLNVAKWLYEMGAGEDIRMKNCKGLTPMWAACSFGHLNVAKWLNEVGAAEHIRSPLIDGTTSLRMTSMCENHSTVLWLVLQGCANDEASGHVDAAVLARDIAKAETRAVLLRNINALLDQHSSFTRFVLPATFISQAEPDEAALRKSSSTCYAKEPLAPQATSLLNLLCGHEESLLALIADFAGVARGRELRNAREAAVVLAADPGADSDSAEGRAPSNTPVQQEQYSGTPVSVPLAFSGIISAAILICLYFFLYLTLSFL